MYLQCRYFEIKPMVLLTLAQQDFTLILMKLLVLPTLWVHFFLHITCFIYDYLIHWWLFCACCNWQSPFITYQYPPSIILFSIRSIVCLNEYIRGACGTWIGSLTNLLWSSGLSETKTICYLIWKMKDLYYTNPFALLYLLMFVLFCKFKNCFGKASFY